MIDYNIISTGSKGNAVVVNKSILIDCGVSMKSLKPYCKDLKLVALTHEHQDHFNKTTIRSLAQNRPTLRFSCSSYLVADLIESCVSKLNIDIVEVGIMYNYGEFNIIPVMLYHNVKNIGYKIIFKRGDRMIYATDTNSLFGVSAKAYDLYMIEANHTEEDIREKIRNKTKSGEFAYEIQSAKNHLSKEKADAFLYENMRYDSRYVYMHCHDDENDPEILKQF